MKDVVRIQSSDELEGVGVKSYDLHSLPSAAAVDSSAAFTALRYKCLLGSAKRCSPGCVNAAGKARQKW